MFKNLFFKKKYKFQAYSMIEMSLLILIIGILFAGAYQGFNIYNETHLSSSRTLTQNSITSRLQNLAFWYETSYENSFQNNENSNGKSISMWLDRNNQQLVKYNLYSAQKTDNKKFNYEPTTIVATTGPTYINNGVGGLPSLNFKNTNTSSNFLAMDSNFKFGKDDVTIFAVIKFKNFENNAVIFDGICLKDSGASTDDDSQAINQCKPLFSAKVNILGYPNLSIQNNDGSSLKSTSNTSFKIKKDVPYIFTFERIFNKSIALYYNGKLSSSTEENLGEIDFLPLKIGRNAKDLNVNSEFDLSELIMIYGKLKNDHKFEIENYLSKKYSIKLER